LQRYIAILFIPYPDPTIHQYSHSHTTSNPNPGWFLYHWTCLDYAVEHPMIRLYQQLNTATKTLTLRNETDVGICSISA